MSSYKPKYSFRPRQMSFYENIYKSYKAPDSGGGLFLKLADGDTVKLRIASQPYIFTNAYTPPGGGETSVSTRYAWVVWNRDEGKAQILQLPVTGFKNLQAIASDDDWGDPQTYDLKLYREGADKQTKYHLTPSPVKTPLTEAEQAEIATVDLPTAIKGAVPLAQVVEGAPVPEPKPKDVVLQDVGDGPVDLSNIPF